MAPKKRGRKAAAAAEPAGGSEDNAKDVPHKKPRQGLQQKTTGSKPDAILETSDKPVIVFAHGAGANSKHEWMVRWQELLAKTTNAVEVITFDYPYMRGEKKKAPPKAEKLVNDHMEQIAKAREKHPGHPVVLVGKSMGSRVGCMVAGQEGTRVAAVVCLGYPLKGMNGQLRDQTLLDLQAPVLFVQGTKDSLCPLDKLEQVRKNIPVQNQLYAIDGGDHSLKVSAASLKKKLLTQAKSDQNAANAIDAFLKKVMSSRS